MLKRVQAQQEQQISEQMKEISQLQGELKETARKCQAWEKVCAIGFSLRCKLTRIIMTWWIPTPTVAGLRERSNAALRQSNAATCPRGHCSCAVVPAVASPDHVGQCSFRYSFESCQVTLRLSTVDVLTVLELFLVLMVHLGLPWCVICARVFVQRNAQFAVEASFSRRNEVHVMPPQLQPEQGRQFPVAQLTGWKRTITTSGPYSSDRRLEVAKLLAPKEILPLSTKPAPTIRHSSSFFDKGGFRNRT